jgi:hypothetical protein
MRTKGTSGFFYRESREEKSNKKNRERRIKGGAKMLALLVQSGMPFLVHFQVGVDSPANLP